MNSSKNHSMSTAFCRSGQSISEAARAASLKQLACMWQYGCPAPTKVCHKSIQFNLSFIQTNMCSTSIRFPMSTLHVLLILSALNHFRSQFTSPSISIGMREVKSTHLMVWCVSRKWMARVSHWPCRWATRCCPRLQWCRRRCRRSSGELQRI